MPVNLPVVGTIEILIAQHVTDFFPCLVIEQQAAEHRLFGLERMRRQLQRIELRIAVKRRYGLGHEKCQS